MRLLVTGARGFVGHNLRRDLGQRHEIVATGRRADPQDGTTALNLEDPHSFDPILADKRPSAVLHCAAMAGPDDCERHPEKARAVNLEAAVSLAEASKRSGARFVHFSTDLVYSGRRGLYEEKDPPDPICLYGELKAESEKRILSADPTAVIVRIGAGYGLTRPETTRRSFLEFLREKLAKGERLGLFTDQFRTPTPIFQLGELLEALLTNEAPGGLYHWGASERINRLSFGRLYCEVFGQDPDLLHGIKMDDFNYLAPRPKDCSLISAKAAEASGVAPLSLREGFERLKASEPAVT